MMKALKALVESKTDKRIGNHAVRQSSYFTIKDDEIYFVGGSKDGVTRSFSYHNSFICHVDDKQRRVYLTNCGWNTISTTRALNDYRRYFVDELGYTEVSA